MTKEQMAQARSEKLKQEELLKSISTRDMTTLDDLSHNFISDIEMRKHFIEKYGQCFENGIRYT